MDEGRIIEKLRECQSRIDVWEEVRVTAIETADFLAWQDRVYIWNLVSWKRPKWNNVIGVKFFQTTPKPTSQIFANQRRII